MMFFLSVLAMWIMGAALLTFAANKTRHAFSSIEFAGMSLFVGMALSVFILFFYSSIGLRVDILNILAMPSLLFVMMSSRYLAKPYKAGELISQEGSPEALSLVEKLLLLAAAVQVVWVFILTIPFPVHAHDAAANYALKAKIFFFHSGIPADFFSWSESTVAHPDYPLFLPLIMTWIYSFIGFNDVLVRLIMPLFYAGFIAVFFSSMRRLFDRSYALLATFILATIPQIGDFATIMHADLILTGFVTTGVLYLIRYIRSGNGIELLLASFMMGSSIWIKNEAMVFTAVFILLLVVLFVRSAREDKKNVLRDVLRSLALIAAISAPWILTRVSGGAVNSDLDIKSLTASRLWENIRHIPALLNLFQQEVFGPKKWNIFWVIFFVSIVWKRKRLFKGEMFYLSVFTGVSALAYFAAYMAMTGENLYFYVNTTISRFMMHFSAVAAVMTGYLLYDEVRKIRPER
ncbi:MAG: glycosyltransferase family 39 protein [Candidatus Omnitrophota bacterium]